MDMKSLFDDGIDNEIKTRINRLLNTSMPLWGKMNVSQMMAHCIRPMEHSLGEAPAPPTTLFKKIFGKLIKYVVLSPKPYKKNLPTDPTFVTSTNEYEFHAERQRLLAILDRYIKNQDRVADVPHPLFGKMTKVECGKSQYKHLDHHLGQFGV